LYLTFASFYEPRKMKETVENLTGMEESVDLEKGIRKKVDMTKMSWQR